MKFSRFERKILAAMVGVAFVPMVGALFLGQAVLREAYAVGVNTRVGDQLERGLALYQVHFTVLRQGAEQAATAIAHDHQLREALEPQHAGEQDSAVATPIKSRLAELLRIYPAVTAIRVLSARDGTGAEDDDGSDREPVVLAAARDPGRVSDDMRMLTIVRDIDGAAARLEVTVAAPSSPFLDYQRAGELAEVYSRLERGSSRVSTFYLMVYMGFLAGAIALAVAIGVVLSRRVTRRVLLLADATRRFGQGDLSVRVPTDVNDEVGELTRAFNTMVSDIRESRTRIEYLQRIGAWQQFARHLAHEIKNPLTPIQLAVQEMNRSYKGDDAEYRARLADATSIVEEEVASLRRLVGEFSEFARLPEAALVSADLGDFLRDACAALEGLSDEFTGANGNAGGDGAGEQAEAGLQVVVEVSSERLPVLIDAMMFRRGIDNLVRNGLQALRDHGRGGTVTVRTGRTDGGAVIEVMDDGPGIDEADLMQIFDPYFTTKSDGTGLGLAIVKKIVLEHNGEISAQPAPGQGALLRIVLPLLES